jgi:hypothetical protein
MDCVSHKLFACSALASYEDGGVALGNLLNQVVNGLHDLRVTDNIGGAKALLKLGLKPQVLFEQAMLFLLS